MIDIFKILFLLVTLSCPVCFGQSDKQFLKNIAELDSEKSVSDLKRLNSEFEKYLQGNPKQWQAYYYSALTAILIAFESHDPEISSLCNKANTYIKKADSLSSDNSELTVLRAMSSAAMIYSDKKKNAIKFGTQANKYADKAIKLNPENPRAYLLKAKAQMHVPVKMGGGFNSAISYYEKAILKFKSFKPQAALDPVWGLYIARKELNEAKQKSTKNGK
jgi:hypothetical protein